MATGIPGLHHITAIAGDPQQNLDFYTGLLSLRLVKLTVNYDDPETYHFYFGDAEAHPGSILTFFPWPGALSGRYGTGQASVVSFAVPAGSLGHWIEHFKARNISVEGPARRFHDEVLSFRDPDGLRLELVASAQSGDSGHAIRGFHSVTLAEEGYQRTAALLTETLGFRLVAQAGNRFRFATGTGGPGALVDIECLPDLGPGRISIGTVHHVAWRTPDDAEQRRWRARIAGLGFNVTPVIDRRYFRSIYFREPGGVLFEIATEGPGFAIDEPLEQLGARLMLPDWLEPRRKDLELRLPPVRLPELAKGA